MEQSLYDESIEIEDPADIDLDGQQTKKKTKKKKKSKKPKQEAQPALDRKDTSISPNRNVKNYQHMPESSASESIDQLQASNHPSSGASNDKPQNATDKNSTAAIAGGDGTHAFKSGSSKDQKNIDSSNSNN